MNAGGAFACEALQKISEVHLTEKGDDALFVFVRVHHCICAELENDSGYNSLKNINEIFADQFAKVYGNIRLGDVLRRDVSDKWISAICAYRKSPHNYLTVLPRMAYAHILDDLPECLLLTSITKESYDSIFEVIIGCLGNVLSATAGDSAARLVQAQLLNNKAGNITLHMLREMAWRKAEKRRSLAQELRDAD